jgi:hypothetical protein
MGRKFYVVDQPLGIASLTALLATIIHKITKDVIFGIIVNLLSLQQKLMWLGLLHSIGWYSQHLGYQMHNCPHRLFNFPVWLQTGIRLEPCLFRGLYYTKVNGNSGQNPIVQYEVPRVD